MVKCKTHPLYKGIRKPRVFCEPCWRFYLGMSKICSNIGCQCDDQPMVPASWRGE